MAEKKNIPAIRFYGFSEDWVESELGKIGEFKNGMNFGKEAISEEITSDYLEKRVALDLFKESSYPKSLDNNRLILELDTLDAKCLIFTKQDQKLPSFPH